jgi:hypothetical protein
MILNKMMIYSIEQEIIILTTIMQMDLIILRVLEMTIEDSKILIKIRTALKT